MPHYLFICGCVVTSTLFHLFEPDGIYQSWDRTMLYRALSIILTMYPFCKTINVTVLLVIPPAIKATWRQYSYRTIPSPGKVNQFILHTRVPRKYFVQLGGTFRQCVDVVTFQSSLELPRHIITQPPYITLV